jgi:DUF4097 and DUF4098 domain-containing protein YvlB
MNLRAYGVIVLAVIVSVAPCGAQEPGVLEQDVEQSYPIDPTANVSIKERLIQISFDVSAQPNAVSIETKFPPRPKWSLGDRSGTVDYVLVLPQTCSISRLELSNGEVLIDGMRGANLHANLGNGRMFGRNCYGDVGLAVTNGDLDVAYDWWERRPFSLHAATTNGDVRAFVPGEAAFHLLAASVNGQVVSDFTGQQDRKAKGPHKIDMLVGEKSEAEVNVHATNGDVKIVEVNP